MAINATRIETVDCGINTAFVDVTNKGVFHKTTTVSMAGHDVITMPQKTAAAVGNGLATGVGMAVTATTISVVGSVACYAGHKIVSAASGVVTAGKRKTKLPHFPGGKNGRKYQEGGNNNE